jgi:lipopolysaccharide heptosyltransferase I
MSQVPKRILIIKPSSLGDIVLALPALSALHDSFPEAEISWLVHSDFAPFLEGHPYLKQLILFHRRKMAHAWYSPSAFNYARQLCRELKNNDFDCVFDFQGLLRTALLARATRCKQRYGMAVAREGAPWFYTHRIASDPDSFHLIDLYLKITRHAGAKEYPVKFVFSDTQQDASSVLSLLDQRKIDPNSYAVIIPGSAHESKCWPAERFALLADKLHSDYGLSVAAVGSQSETEVIERISAAAQVPVINLAGQTTLKTLVSLLRTARLVVANDTGPGHVAAGLGVPLVMLFSWSNPARIYPYERPECIAAIDPFDRGRTIKSRDPKHNVRNISFDTVYEKVCQQLQ